MLKRNMPATQLAYQELTKQGLAQWIDRGYAQQATSHALSRCSVLMPAPGAFEGLAAQFLAIHANDGSDSLFMVLKLDKAIAALAVRLHFQHISEL